MTPKDTTPTGKGPDDDGLAADSGERYELGERIATGGMGEVWRAHDTVLGREVAVKILKREYADDLTFRARFAAEARHAAGLHHPGIASVFDYGLLKEGNTPYLVMELVNGKPLSELLANREPFDPEQARMLALQTAEALAVAHEAGVVHRDVKPGNLLVTPDGRVKITDFGIARATGSVAFTQTGQIVGTPHYLSPEQARGDSATAASDVYALGVVLFECLSGRRPFDADTPIATALAQIQQDVPPLPDTIPTALADVVVRALAKNPAERYADGAEIAAALRAAGGDAAPVPIPAPGADQTRVIPAVAPVPDRPSTVATSPTTKNRSRWPLYAGGLLALALVAALLISHPWTQDGGTDGAGANSNESDTVRVRRSAYVGEPVDEVNSALRDKGLKTKVESLENSGDEEADTVADLDPTGQVEKGASITLQVWGDPPPEEPSDEEKTKPADPDESDDSDNSGPGGGKPSKPSKPEKSDEPGETEGSPPAQGRVEPTKKGG